MSTTLDHIGDVGNVRREATELIANKLEISLLVPYDGLTIQ